VKKKFQENFPGIHAIILGLYIVFLFLKLQVRESFLVLQCPVTFSALPLQG